MWVRTSLVRVLVSLPAVAAGAFGAVTALAQPAAAPASKPAPAKVAPAASAANAAGALPGGMRLQMLREGQGASPKASDTVRVHYRGTFMDGREFDSSIARGQPTEFPLNRVIPCWTEGLQRIKVGGKARLTCPPAMAYGSRGAGSVIPPDSTLQFEVELLGIVGGK